MTSWLEKARKEENLTLEDCASALGCSRATFESRVKNPGTLSINELCALDKKFSKRGARIARDAIKDALPNFFTI